MEKFIQHCDQIEDDILKMISNLETMLDESGKLYATTQDQTKQDE